MSKIKKTFNRIFNDWIARKADREDLYYKNRTKEAYSLDLIKRLIREKKYNKPKEGLKILKVYKNHNWEDLNLLPALKAFGEVIEYDLSSVKPYSVIWQIFKKRRFNRKFLKDVSNLAREGKINVIFFYSSGLVFLPKIIKALADLNLPMINLSLDDYLKFKGYPTLTGWSGNVDIAKYMTLTVVSYKEACEKYLAESAIPLYLPEGANPAKFKPVLGLAKDIDICFIGKNYGIREESMKFLKDNGVNIQVYGRGWPSGGVSHEQMMEYYSRAKIALGMSDSWGTGRFDLPGRDFEVPLIGSMYLTEYNDKIGAFYKIGEEIVLYKNRQDLLEKIKYYLVHDAEREKIAYRGRDRAMKEHTWEKRFDTIFRLLNII